MDRCILTQMLSIICPWLADLRIPYSNFSAMQIRIAELAKAAGF